MILKFYSKFICIAFLCAVVAVVPAFAQSEIFSEVSEVNLRDMKPILEDGVVKGYYMFYLLDQKDKNTSVYQLKFLDQNLNVIGSKKIKGPKGLSVMQSSFNGKNLLIKFIDPVEKKFVLRQYNQAGELASLKRTSYLSTDLTGYTNGNFSNYYARSYSQTLMAIPQKGFVDISTVKNKKLGYKISFYHNTREEQGWTYTSNKNAEQMQTLGLLGANEDVLVLSVVKRPNRMSKKFENFVLAIDVNTGEKIFEKPIQDNKHNSLFFRTHFDKDSQEITLFGLYYKDPEKVANGASLGVSIFRVDKSGEILAKNFLSWEYDFAKILTQEDKDNSEKQGFGMMHFHDIIKTNDGKLMIVGERMKKAVSALGIASLALRGNVALIKIMIQDLVVFELDTDLELKSMESFEKHKTSVELPRGFGVVNINTLGLFFEDYFDYIFTNQIPDEDYFSVVYSNWDRKQREFELHTANYAEGEYSTDKIPLAIDATSYMILKAKPEHILIAEYYKKKKELKLRMEKLNY